MAFSPPSKTFSRLATTPLVALGEYDCKLGHRAIGPEGATVQHALNLHRRGTYLKHVDGRDVFVEPGSVVFFARGEPYCTSHPYGCGDGGAWITVSESALSAAWSSVDARALDRPARPFPLATLPPDAATTLEFELWFARARHAPALEIEEHFGALLVLLARRANVLSGARPVVAQRDTRRSRRRRELAMALRSRLERSLERDVDEAGLAGLASEFDASPFALCRAFRAETGLTMSAWRRRVRLQRALERVLGSRENLLAIALELGFASHSHLTREFRAHFGWTPSALRARVQRRAALGRELGAQVERRGPRA